MKKKLLLLTMMLFFAVGGGFVASAQTPDWVRMMQDPKVNFYDVQKAFNQYYEKAKEDLEELRSKGGVQPADGDLEEEEGDVPGYKLYKRWEWFMLPRINPDGTRPDAWHTYQELLKYKQEHGEASLGNGNSNRSANPSTVMTGGGNWTPIGPNGPSGSGTTYGPGRINAVRIDPNNPNTIYVCAPSGGLWKSTNGGSTWTTSTDWIGQVIGCSDLAIDPNNSNILYLATGDLDHTDNSSVGLLKSTDGGNTWLPTGLSFGMGAYILTSRVFISPTNSNVILVGATNGIYRSTDAGVTFTKVSTTSVKDMEMKPNDPNTYYACNTTFVKSTDGGITWNAAGTGLSASSTLNRMAIAVTAADPARVYLIGIRTAYAVDGFFTSTNSGANFTKTHATVGANFGTQGWYDLGIGANPTNAMDVLVGGQTAYYRTTTGGTAFTDVHAGSHVDYHDCVFTKDGATVYLTSDGGIWKATVGATLTWNNLSAGLTISQIYGFGQSATNPNMFITGHQDCGTWKYGGTWSGSNGGDGMLAFISWANDQNQWSSQYEGTLARSTNAATSWSSCKPASAGTGSWVTPWKEDPTTANTIYAGYLQMWKSINGGTSWTQIGTLPGSVTVPMTAIDISPASSNVIWCTNGGSLYKTNNGGTVWTAITAPIGSISDIGCSPTDPLKAWIVMSGFNGTRKVFVTTNQGSTWTDVVSGSLPNVPVNCITPVRNSASDALYIGTDVGTFYKDNTLTVWQPFYNQLPNVVVSQIGIFYVGGVPNKIRASTFGRGLWESDPYQAGAYTPTANFVASSTISCPGTAVQFTDYSSGQPTSWSWSFPGGSPSSSTQQSPLVVYNTPGTYSVTLSATNGNGTDVRTATNLITVAVSPYNAPTASGKSFCGTPPKVVSLSATGTGTGTIRWWDSPGGGTQVGTGPTISPTLSTTTSYYVDESFPAGASDIVGESFMNIGTGTWFASNDIRGLYFDVLKPVILNTVQVYANSAGNRTIQVLDANGNAVAETTLYMIAAPNTLTTYTLNFNLYPGKDYFIKCVGNVDLWRNDAGAVYPYTSTDINITNSNAGSPGYYYFFYNWEYTEIVCNTARRTVVVTDTCSTIGIEDVFANGSLEIYPNPNKGVFNLSFFVQNKDNYQIQITNALGQSILRKNLGEFAGAYSQQIDIGEFGKGLYLLSITNSRNETVKKVIVY